MATRSRASADEELGRIIRPLRTARYETDVMFGDLEEQLVSYGRDWGGLDLTPDFQRGHIWRADQQQHFIENILRGVVASSGFVIQMNCPNWDSDDYDGDLPRGFQCIDGLQRITAVRRMLAGEVHPFGLTLDALNNSSFSITRIIYRFRLAVHNFESRADLLTHYLDINTGGTPHSAAEIERVSRLLQQCQLVDAADAAASSHEDGMQVQRP